MNNIQQRKWYHIYTKEDTFQMQKYAQQRHEILNSKTQWLIHIQNHIGKGINNAWNMSIQWLNLVIMFIHIVKDELGNI